MREFDPVSLEIIWSRLLNVTEEMWTTILRTAVSTIIASANDFGCEIMDAEGRSIAHAYRSMPVFNMTMPNVTKEILKKYPANTLKPGDVFLTNDPWLCAGHLPDIAVVTPIFFQGRFVGFAGNIANTSDIGGSLDAKSVRDSYEEGIFFPICKLYDDGEPNELVFDMFRWNVRAPDMVLTDIEAQVAANEVGRRRVAALLDEYQLEDLSALSLAIRSRSEAAMRRAISGLRDGEYYNEVYTDGVGTPLKIAVKISVNGDEMVVDYAGSSPQVDWGGINCTLIYSTGHTLYPMACLLAPDVPVNEGCFQPITTVAPEGSIINCTFPISVGSRVNTGWYIHGAIFGALAQALPGDIQSGNGLMSSLHTYGFDGDGQGVQCPPVLRRRARRDEPGRRHGAEHVPQQRVQRAGGGVRAEQPRAGPSQGVRHRLGRRRTAQGQPRPAGGHAQGSRPRGQPEHLFPPTQDVVPGAGHLRRR